MKMKIRQNVFFLFGFDSRATCACAEDNFSRTSLPSTTHAGGRRIVSGEGGTMPFPIIKLVTLAGKQISKPIANSIKRKVKGSPWFRDNVCVPLAQSKYTNVLGVFCSFTLTVEFEKDRPVTW